MFWVVQNNIYRERGHACLMETLKEKNIPHKEVKVVPFYDILLPSDFDSHNFNDSIDQTAEITIDNSGPIITMGGLSLVRIGEKKGWKPGSFLNENFHYKHWVSAFGENLLNYESVVDTFENIKPKWDTFFIRPCEDTKDFAGVVYTKEEFEKWRKDLLKTEGACMFVDAEVTASPVKTILEEYRFFVVDGKIITGSQYKLGNRLYKSSKIEGNIVQFAQKMVDIWQPSRAFVVDIANTDEGLKVIEINNFNSAGFYHSDVVKIVEAVENMKF